MSYRNVSVTCCIPTSLHEHNLIQLHRYPCKVNTDSTHWNRNNAAVLLTCPAIREERKMRVGDQLPSFPAASIREDPQGLLDHCKPAAVPSGRMAAEDEGCTCKMH